MPSALSFATVTQQQLFARLGEGHSAGVTVLTPNRRLASALSSGFAAFQAGRGMRAWESADVLPVDAFVGRLYEDALYSPLAGQLPVLLTPSQELLLWADTIAASDWAGLLLAHARIAQEARKAWLLAHHWRIEGMLGSFPGNEDTLAFADWAARYRRQTTVQRQTDAARLPGLAAKLLAEPQVRRPATLVLYAFDIVTPQLNLLLAECAAAGMQVLQCRPERHEAKPCRMPLASADLELLRAASWARARLEAAGDRPVRIGIVLPDLELRRKDVVRVMSQALQPDWCLPGSNASALPFNLSLGVPLSQHALVQAALSLLALALGSVDFAVASRLLRSPFLGGAAAEAPERARLDVALRKRAPARLNLAQLIRLLEPLGMPPRLQFHLQALLGQAGQGGQGGQGGHVLASRAGGGRASLHAWAERYTGMLKAAGFPGERTLDSTEFQTLAKWNETLAELGSLAMVAPAATGQEAVSRLNALCAERLFQPESGTAPIQVLGVLESAGLVFDHLWIAGMTDEAWPLPARPHPFIAPALQKKAGVPEAGADTALELDRRITQDWLQAAPEVVISHALREDDRELSPSPLIAGIEASQIELADVQDPMRLLHAASALEPLPQGPAPAVPPQAAARLRGGSRVLSDQSACPFRAYAAHRLAAAPLETPSDGWDAAARGNLLHALMKGIWDRLKDHRTLLEADAAQLDEVIGESAAAAIERVRRDHSIGDEFAALERRRLATLAREWLDIERMRPPFEVVASEARRALQAAGLTFSGRIDRMDRLADGSHVLIDYKTGAVTPRHWEGVRPQDPQLPLYAVNAPEVISAVAFARLKTGAMRFMGYSRDKDAVPGVKQYREWDRLLQDWAAEVRRLGRDFAAGDASVDPKQPGLTCRYCSLQPLCRVHERYSALAMDADPDAAGSDSDTDRETGEEGG